MISEKMINKVLLDYDNENANMTKSNNTSEKEIVSLVNKHLAFNKYLPKDSAKAHLDGLLHFHDMDFFLLRPNCLNHPVVLLFKYGLSALTCTSKPAKRLQVAVNQMLKALSLGQGHMAGGQGVPLFNVLLAPFASGASYDEIKQAMQHFVYECNQINASRGFQTIFSNINCEYHIPDFLKNETVEYSQNKGCVYGDFEDESRLIIKALCEVFLERDAVGKPFLFPNFITVLRKDISADDEILMKVIETNMTVNNAYYLNMTDNETDLEAAMGCIESNEVVMYKYKGILHVESIKKLHTRLIKDGYIEKVFGVSKYIETKDLFIYDVENGFVEVTKFIKNPNKNNWLEVMFENGRVVTVTQDHPFYTTKGFKKAAKLLSKDDAIYIQSGRYIALDTFKFNTELAWLLGVLLYHLNDEQKISFASLRIDPMIVVDSVNTLFKDKLKAEIIDDELMIKITTLTDENLTDVIKIDGLLTSVNTAKYSFIAGLIDSSATVKFTGKNTKVRISSFNKELVLQTMYLVQMCGIHAEIYNINDEYVIMFALPKDVVNFIKSQEQIDNCEQLDNEIELRFVSKVIMTKEVKVEGYSYDVETKTGKFAFSGVQSSNCRTRLSSEFTGNYQKDVLGTGNFEYATLNLPRIALMQKFDKISIYETLAKNIQMAVKGLLVRRSIMNKNILNNMYPFFSKYNDEEYGQYYNIEYSTMSVGFTGLHEFTEIMNYSYNDSLKFMETFRTYVDELNKYTYEELAKKYGVEYTPIKDELSRWSVIGSPAESCSFRMKDIDKRKYKSYLTEAGLYDKLYYTNSFHVPEDSNMNALMKVIKEAPFHKICNAGSITHIWNPEVDSDLHNIAEFVTNTCFKTDMKYMTFSPTLAYCKDCGASYPVSEEQHSCKVCGSSNVSYLSKITGYLAEVDNWNAAKKQEFKNRTSFMVKTE